MEIFSAITLLSLGALLFSVVRRGFLGFEGNRSVKFWKTLTVMSTLANLIIVIIVQNTLNDCLSSELASLVEFGIGNGALLSFFGVLLIAFLKLRNVSKREEEKDDYDNADISYAPYVLYNKN
jgi:uncharacterized integral membrane protein